MKKTALAAAAVVAALTVSALAGAQADHRNGGRHDQQDSRNSGGSNWRQGDHNTQQGNRTNTNDRWQQGNRTNTNDRWQQGSTGHNTQRGDHDADDRNRNDHDWDDRNRNRNDHDWDDRNRNRNDRDWDDRNRNRNYGGGYVYTSPPVYNYPSYGYNDGYYNGGGYYNNRSSDNEWQSIAMAAGALAVIGLLEHDDTLVFGGAAGALYSIYRLDQDRRSSNAAWRARARFFDQPYFIRNGVRYERRTVTQRGERFYQFVRCN
jgi:hypothetical protein